MKKMIIIVTILLLVGGVGYWFYKTKINNNFTYTTTDLNTVTINNVEYSTTGSIPSGKQDGNLEIEEGITLLNKGPVQTTLFNLKMPGNGSITVELKAPYDKSKAYFLDWLKKNNFTHINTDSLNYINLP